MANLIISFYGSAQNGCGSQPGGSQVVVTSAVSAQSAANANGAEVVSLWSDTAHYVTVGANPTATATNGVYVPALTLHWLDLNGTADKIAAITA
jgi:hypothetical protein